MKWEELTGDQFPKAVADCGGVCIVPLAVIERHGPHLPLGTDMINGLHCAAEAAKLEPAIVAPPWYIGQIYEAKCFPGTISFPPRLLVENILHLYDEIGRNGFAKIVAYICHGGNNNLAPFLAQCQLDAPKSYQVYTVDFLGGQTEQQKKRWQEVMDTKDWFHAEELETSMTLAHRPDLVDMKAVKGGAKSLDRMAALGQGFSGFGWYARYPEHYAGDARPATAEKGRVINDTIIEALANFIRAVKQDKVAPALAAEFFARESSIRQGAKPGGAKKKEAR